jgi:hypothetical protein
VLCILLVAYVSIAEISHIHPKGSKHPTHTCSVCSVAHSGISMVRVFVPSPLVAVADALKVADASPRNLLVVSSLFIRPPPLV